MKQRGAVFVAGKPQRGSSVSFPDREGCSRFDVTSGSNAKLGTAALKNLSPLLIGPCLDCDGKKVVRFENFYQYQKVLSELGYWDSETKQPTPKWKAWHTKGQAKLKNGKGIRTPPEISAYKKKCGAKPVPIGSW